MIVKQIAENLGDSNFEGEVQRRLDKECATLYWGVLCRTCSKPVAFDTLPCHKGGLGSINLRPGAISCEVGHNHIYFPRDFRFFAADALITGKTMDDNRLAHRAINPSSDSLYPQR
jgi:hypothetical protein